MAKLPKRRTRFSHGRKLPSRDATQAVGGLVGLGVNIAEKVEAKAASAIREERRRLARDLHDGAVQDFNAAVLQLDVAEDAWAQSPEVSLQCIRKARELARVGIENIRHLMWTLHSKETLQEETLVDALRRHLYSQTANTSITAEFSLRGHYRRAPAEIESNLFQIACEAIRNAMKHGNPTLIRVSLFYNTYGVELRIADDGERSDQTSRQRGSGFGMVSMRERAELIGALLKITHHPISGTRVTIHMRIPHELRDAG